MCKLMIKIIFCLCSNFLIVKIKMRCTFLFVQCGSSSKSGRNRKTLPGLQKNAKERTPKGNQRVRKSTERSAKTIPAQKNRSSLKTSELPTLNKAAISVALDKQATLSARVDPPKSSHQGNSGRVSVKPASRESIVPSSEDTVKTAEASERKSKNEKSKKQSTLLNRCSAISNDAR